jgi:5'-3' exonuclease
MGIQNFSKTFKSTKVIKMKNLAGKKIAIDAMTEIYRSALGAKSVSTLTDKYGNPTLHINVILANIIDMQNCKVDQIWVFDHDKSSDENKEYHNPAKLDELLRRKKIRDEAKEKLEEIEAHDKLAAYNITKSKSNSIIIEPSVEEILQDLPDDMVDIVDNYNNHVNQANHDNEAKKESLKKQIFTATREMINDVKLILNCLNIRYIEAPAGYEGEQIASYLSSTDQCYAVYSGDTDAIPFGAKIHYRKSRDKKIYEYVLSDILNQIAEANDNIKKPTIADLRKACIALGCDYAPKTPGVGAKTVLKKLDTIKLTTVQKKKALTMFMKEPTEDIEVYNLDKTPFVNCKKDILLEWLVTEKSFSKVRVAKWLDKVK